MNAFWMKHKATLGARLLGALISTFAASSADAGSLAGVHWYSGDRSLLDESLPIGERGWNVESFYGVEHMDSFRHAFEKAKVAKAHGLRNIIRIDASPNLPVPYFESEYPNWASKFIARVRDLQSVSNIFIVGNEPTIEPDHKGQSASDYARAYNYLFARKAEMPAGTRLLAAGPATYSWDRIGNRDFLAWLEDMSNQLKGVDGFALHTYADPSTPGCADPRLPCKKFNWTFDGGFLSFKDQALRVAKKWKGTKPIYITETTTDTNGRNELPNPVDNYTRGWMGLAFEAIRTYNQDRPPGMPEIRALCWFVDRDDGGWANRALVNMAQARDDMRKAYKDAKNRIGAEPADTGTPVALPDAIVTGIRWEPADAQTGDAVRFIASIKNQGKAATGATVGVNFSINGQSVGWASRAAMAAGESAINLAMVQEWIVPTGASFQVTAHVDDVNRFSEENESNNKLSQTITIENGAIGMPDVFVEKLWWTPESPKVGDLVQFHTRVRNSGDVSTGATVGVAYFVNDRYIGWGSRAALNSGEASDQFSMTSKWTATSGNHKIRGLADDVDRFDESDETNNARVESMVVAQGTSNPTPTVCPCLPNYNNFCQYGASYPACPMTEKGGYCDPNRDGSFGDADWVKGFNEYHAKCAK